MRKISFTYLTIFHSLLVLGFLLSPFIFLKIGPGGYKYYGPTVPDIYIYGYDIFGKDKSWPGINFAWKFQLITILIYLLSSILQFLFQHSAKWIRALLVFNLVLWVLFPLWINFYTGGVINNSDCADLTLHYSYGWFFYFGIGLTLVLLLVKSRKHIE